MSLSLHFSNANDGLVRTDEELNMSNSNACAFLSAIGIDAANIWDATPAPIAELSEAIDRYVKSEIAEYVDGGKPATGGRLPGGALLVDCGRRPGYISEKVATAQQCVREALAKGATTFYFC